MKGINKLIYKNFFKNKKILITGSTGFKGSWLHLLLNQLGANVYGIGLKPNKDQRLSLIFKSKLIKTTKFINVLNKKKFHNFLLDFKPEIIFHLAAQSLVSASQKSPLETLNTNIIGTANILESLRILNRPVFFLNITSDKCYQNNELKRSFVESDPLGGKDIYSSSKACSEIVTKSYNDIFFSNSYIKISTARAGNIIGGGDFSCDRLLPDIAYSYYKNKNLKLRSPISVRPWQYVFDVLNGYLLLAYKAKMNKKFDFEAFNFSSNKEKTFSVQQIVDYLEKNVFDMPFNYSYKKSNIIESTFLKLNSAKSNQLLGWKPQYAIEKSLSETIKWYKNFYEKKDMLNYSLLSLKEFFKIK